MSTTSILRKPKLHFDTVQHPNHVTFDDGRAVRRNLPWCRFIEARWDYREPDVLQVEIGAWLVVIQGHNLGALFATVEDHSLIRVKAQPELSLDAERELDTFVSAIRFTPMPSRAPHEHRGDQTEVELGMDSAL